MIHKSSVIASKAKIGKNVKVGPFCLVGPNVQLDNCIVKFSNYSEITLKELSNTNNTNGTVELRAFKENGTNGDNARCFSIWNAGKGGTNAERLRLDSDGRLILGGSASFADANSDDLQLQGTSHTGMIIKSGTTSYGSIYFGDATSGGARNAGILRYNHNGDHMQIWSGEAERIRIGSATASMYMYKVTDEVTVASSSDLGVTLCGGNAKTYNIFTADNNTTMYIGRQTSDGNLIDFRQEGTHEGSISVSGATVSYNGGHLARWSQLPGLSNTDVADRPTIYRGTVMSNLDEMCDWTGEENLQLNKTQVSTAASDPNVAGIFWEWDDNEPIQGESHDYKNDFFIAMTGDTIIRVGAGVSVTKGDLLESAGNGTARPQSDDIIRSKTVAKVTSNVGIVTYADNSYCVPCLLMAC